MAFDFRFATLLQRHRRARDEAGVEVGKANEAIRRIDQQYDDLLTERTTLLKQSGAARVGSISIDRVLSQGRYEVQLGAEMVSLRQTRAQLEQELGRRQQVLVAAEAEVRRFERLEENEQAVYRAEQQRREQAAADEASATRYLMERRRR